MNKDAVIQLNKRWISEKQCIIDMYEEKIAIERKRITEHEERIESLEEEDVKAK